MFEEALDNVRPQVEVRSRRVGGATYQVPVEVRPVRRQRARHPMARGLGSQTRSRSPWINDWRPSSIEAASESRGTAAKKREDTHRMAEANKAFAHYRW